MAARLSAEAPVAFALLFCVLLGFCAANGLWDAASWKLPSAYLDAEKADVLLQLATQKALLVPFAPKTVAELGAPGVAHWDDYPVVEEFQNFFAGVLTRAFGPFLALNLYLLLGCLLAALAMYGVARWFAVSRPWSFAAALAFALAPYGFAQSPHHPTVAWDWHVALFLPIWSFDSLELRSRRFWYAVAVALFAGMQNVYYTAALCLLTLAVALVKKWGRSALFVLGAAAAGFALMQVDTWLFEAQHGANPGALVRAYKWLEIYALKPVDLFVPPATHRWFAAIGEHYARERVSQDEGSYLGLAGICALLLLATDAAKAALQKRQLPREAWLVLLIFAVFVTGGLNSFLGVAGLTLFRTACRFSIVILAIVLLYAARRLSKQPLALAAVASVVVLLEQPPVAPNHDVIAKQVHADEAFAAQLQSALPAGAMIFQLPVMDFPESPVQGVAPYDHLRPFLYTHGLRYSFGDVKGRDSWQQELARRPFDELVSELQKRGFAALYVNRNAYDDKAARIVQALAAMGHPNTVENSNGDVVAVLLR